MTDGSTETETRPRPWKKERAIPPDSRKISGPADSAVYLYEKDYKTRKDFEKKTYYAKAFRDGDIAPLWHQGFRSALERAKKIGEFLDAEENRLAARPPE